ncbi:MAG: TIGR00366 family protein [Bacteroidota bacterium]
MSIKDSSSKRWYEQFPHPVVLIFFIIILMALLSYILPAGSFEREMIEGRARVIPGSYKITPEANPVSFLDMFRAIPQGFIDASHIIFIVLSSGIMFGVLERSGMIENTVGTLVKEMGTRNKYLLVVLFTYLYGLLGIMIGYENNIAMVPIAAVICLALGGDLILAAGVSVGAITVGFGLSPINPYTVGVGHSIAEMPLFSGTPLRLALVTTALTVLAFFNVRYFKRIEKDPNRSLGKGLDTSGFALSKDLKEYTVNEKDWMILSIFLVGIGVMLYGIFNYHWYINDLSAIFVIISIVAGLAAGLSGTQLSETAFKSISIVAPGAFMVGFATSIKVVMETGGIGDTIANGLSSSLMGLPTYASAVFMSMAQSLINLLIPSGSGQALATLPIMIPVGEVLGLTRQTTILAFQIGDGVTNLFNPALGGLLAMLSLCRVPFDRWLRFILPVVGIIIVIAWLFLVFSVAINWGPV